MPNSSNIGGVAIYIKKEHKVTEKGEYKILSSNNAKVENLWYEITKGSKSYRKIDNLVYLSVSDPDFIT